MTLFDIGTVTAFDDATAVHIPDVLVAAKAVALAPQKAQVWNLMKAPSLGITGKSFEIYGRTDTSLDGTIGTGAGTGWVDGTAVTALPMASAAIHKLVIGSVIKVESEVVVVKSIDRSANTIAVWSRGAGSSTAAAHADTTAFTTIGYAAHDTDLKNIEARAENTFKYTNYVSTIYEIIDYTLSQQLIGRQGIGDGNANIQLLKNEAMNRVSKHLARMAILGYKQAGGKATDPYMGAGLLSQLEDTSGGTRPVLRYNASTTDFTETHLKAALAANFALGNPDTIILNQTYKNIANKFNNAFINIDRSDKTAGNSVKFYEYEGKVLNFIVDSDMPSGKVVLANSGMLYKSWQQGDVLRFVDEPKASSRENRGSLQGSVAFAVEGVGYEHCEMYGLN